MSAKPRGVRKSSTPSPLSMGLENQSHDLHVEPGRAAEMPTNTSASVPQLGLLLDFLAADIRPSCVVKDSTIIYANAAFSRTKVSSTVPRYQSLVSDPIDESEPGMTQRWRRWLLEAAAGDRMTTPDAEWLLQTASDGIRVFVATMYAQLEPASNEFDIALSTGCISSDFYNLLVSVDWGATALGAPHSWSTELRRAVAMALASTEPTTVHWGPDRIMLYNENYPQIIRDMHPQALGRSARVNFAGIWDPFEALILQVEVSGCSRGMQGMPVTLKRSGDEYEEAYFDARFVPVRDTKGHFIGIFNQAVETTTQVVYQHRMDTIHAMGRASDKESPLDLFWHDILGPLDFEDSEVPFAAVYSHHDHIRLVRDDQAEATCDRLVLQARFGKYDGCTQLPEAVDLHGTSGIALAFQKAESMKDPLLMRPEQLFLPDGVDIAFGEHISQENHRVVICQLQVPPFNSRTVIIIGIRKLRPYDNDYRSFIYVFLRQLEASVASTIKFSQEREGLEGSVKQAAIEKENLMHALATQTREAAENAWRFLEFARHAPVGVYIFEPSGDVAFANDTWYQYFDIPPGTKGAQMWRDVVHPDDLSAVDEKWGLLVSSGINHVDFEFRTRTQSKIGFADLPSLGWRYLSSTCFAEMTDDGTLKSVTGVIIDSTPLRLHELDVAQRLNTALEAKRVQENFMDNHEMRNPLNAMLQSAEEARNLLETELLDASTPLADQPMDELLDLLSTILYCGNHQKQIIDDVLTISKLDANLLSIAPALTDPMALAKQALEIHKSDIRTEDIKASIHDVSGTAQMPIMVDPGRVLQVLLNMLGNAVKFLKGRQKRELRIEVSTTRERPVASNMRFFSSGQKRGVLTNRGGSSDQDLVYLHFSVIDTGPGIAPKEMEQLFGRFRQASPRTHAQYGGSGLGLFISRELTELHGGEIGVASEPGVGTTFSFYVQGYTSKAERSAHAHVRPSKRQAPTHLTSDRTADRSHSRQELPLRSVAGSRSGDSTASERDGEVAEITATLLVVEDNLINQRILLKQLKREHFGTVAADNGELALASIMTSSRASSSKDKSSPAGLAAKPVDLCLCDLEMPVMDGMSTVRRVRELESQGILSGHLPMIAVTGNARSELIQAAKQAGFDDVVCKPYTFQQLVALVRRMVAADVATYQSIDMDADGI